MDSKDQSNMTSLAPPYERAECIVPHKFAALSCASSSVVSINMSKFGALFSRSVFDDVAFVSIGNNDLLP